MSSHRDDAGDVYFYCGKLDKSSCAHPLSLYVFLSVDFSLTRSALRP